MRCAADQRPAVSLSLVQSVVAAVWTICTLTAHAQTPPSGGQTGVDNRNLQVQAVASPSADATRKLGRRIALVIGNAAYKDAPLTNPVNDARAMAQAMRDSGFTVTLLENVDHRAMLSAVREFGDQLRGGGTGLFYFAGHGVQIKGRNYLVPVGGSIAREDEVVYQAIDAQSVLDKMESAGNLANIMILDACRNNPYTRGSRNAQAGLAQMDAPVGTLVAYATSPGSVASDGDGANGLYTRHLLDALRRPGSKVEDVFKQVRANVRRASQGRQVPWEATSMEGDFYFSGGPPVAGAAPAASTRALELALWDAVKDSQIAVELRAYLMRYPQGQFSQAARERLSRLQAPPAPVVVQVDSAQTSAVPAEAALMPGAVDALALDQDATHRRNAELLTQLATLIGTPPAPSGNSAIEDPNSALRRHTQELLASIAAQGTKLSMEANAPSAAAAVQPAPVTNSHGFTEGDRWVYQVVDKFKGVVVRDYAIALDEILPDGSLHMNKGNLKLDPSGNRLYYKAPDRERYYLNGFSMVPTSLIAGMKTPLDYEIVHKFRDGRLSTEQGKGSLVVKGRESVKTPAGDFNAWRVEIDVVGRTQGESNGFRWLFTGWFVPELNGYAAYDDESRQSNGTFTRRERHELTSFSVRSADGLAKR